MRAFSKKSTTTPESKPTQLKTQTPHPDTTQARSGHSLSNFSLQPNEEVEAHLPPRLTQRRSIQPQTPSTTERSSVIQRVIRLGDPGSYSYYTDMQDVLDSAKKAGYEFKSIVGNIESWLNDGTTHEYKDWSALASEFKLSRSAMSPSSMAPAGLAAPPSISAPAATHSSAAPAAATSSVAAVDRSVEEEDPDGDSEPSVHSAAAAAAAAADPEAIARLRAKLAPAPARPSANAPETKALSVRKSTINFSRSALTAAAVLNMDADALQSRKPHTKRGTGSSGTNHSAADAKAAVRARNMIEDKIHKKTGVHQSADSFLHNAERSAAAAAARTDKAQAAASKQLEKLQDLRDDYLDWLAHLASKSGWIAKEKAKDNTPRTPPSKPKKIKQLAALAVANDWPLEWDDTFGPELYGD